MGSLVVRILGAVGAAALSVTVFGSGIASAVDGLTGISYDEAASWISSHNGSPVIGSVSGDQVDKSQCIVTSWHKSNFLNASGRNDRASDYVLNLNCNNPVASPGKPGNSVMSPAGVAAKKDQTSAENISKNPEWCQTTDKRMQWCQNICKRTGLCEI
jgi:hypothetical protein